MEIFLVQLLFIIYLVDIYRYIRLIWFIQYISKKMAEITLLERVAQLTEKRPYTYRGTQNSNIMKCEVLRFIEI